MCTVIVRVPEQAGEPLHLLAIRDEDPQREWQPLGPWWPEAHPGVVGVRDARAGGAWLAAEPSLSRVAVLLNRADLSDRPESELVSRGGVVLDAVDGRSPSGTPPTHGFNLVQATARSARVTHWDGASLRVTDLEPGTHMVAHDDVDDPQTARISRWRDEFATAELPVGDAWWQPWLGVLEESASLAVDDDRTIIRDNRPFGYPTLSLLACAVRISPDGTDLAYAELDEPGRWNPLRLA
jgi:hypothetical protein